MRKKKISEVMNYLDEIYIEEVALYKEETQKRHRIRSLKWVGMAACLAMMVLVGAVVMSRFWAETKVEEQEDLVTLEQMNRPYKGLQVNTNTLEMAFLRPYEYLHLASKCGDMKFQGNTYVRSFGLPDKSMIGKGIGTAECEVYGGDFFDRYVVNTQTFDVYKLRGIDEECFIVVKIEDKVLLYQNKEYEFPTTFGDLIKVYNLKDNLKLERFRVYEKNKEKGYFALEEDDYLWKVLSKCKNVTLVDDEMWEREERNYLSFTATSKEVGVHKKVFYVTEDGYIWTNMFAIGMLFEIGEAAANKIISYATEHGVETESEPYSYRLAGTITEFGEDYIFISDAVLCENPEDGITFKVPMDGLNVKFYEEYLEMKIGDLVSVEYKYGIDTKAGNEVQGVIDIEEAYFEEDGTKNWYVWE